MWSPANETVELLDRCTFPEPTTKVTCALSGGADSTALVVLAVAAGCSVSAVHVNHGLRPSADDDAECARQTAEHLGVSFRCAHIDLEDGPNLEARARDARREILGPDAMTGHTADDQAETLLLALLRGSGAKGLAAITPGHRHPILALRSNETRELCGREALTFAIDPSNNDPRFRRNRVRHELLPLLNRIAERDVTTLLNRTADLLRNDDDLLDSMAASLDPTDVNALNDAPKALAARSIRQWLTRNGYPPGADAVTRVLTVASGDTAACEVAGGIRIERRQDRLQISPDGHSAR
ncbi:MAG: tRNA lysidine(34) synthetase TilS [Actinobacteria bacterium]|nr:MAG: tRNA lysidine(34) synthetase TilS [Actinomycetota bacterium]